MLGAFLVLPALIALQRMLTGRLSACLQRRRRCCSCCSPRCSCSFSRARLGPVRLRRGAADGSSPSSPAARRSERLRIVADRDRRHRVLALLLVAALLSIDQVADLFKERASLEQSYDAGHLGRFGRYILGVDWRSTTRSASGRCSSPTIFPEDPHNTFLNAFMAGGWLGGFAYSTLMLVTLMLGLRYVFVRTPWQPTYIAVYAAFLGDVGESDIIDIEHWRHYYLILGVLWGLMAVSRPRARCAADRSGPSMNGPAPQPSPILARPFGGA